MDDPSGLPYSTEKLVPQAHVYYVGYWIHGIAFSDRVRAQPHPPLDRTTIPYATPIIPELFSLPLFVLAMPEIMPEIAYVILANPNSVTYSYQGLV